MALTACGIKIAINGSETDVDVENDSASWTTKVGNVKVTTGGGSFWRDPRPGVCNIDVIVPLHLAPLIRTVTIGVTLIASTVSTMPTGTIGSGAGAYRIIFHGDVQSIKGTPAAGATAVQIDAVSEMSGLLNRKARTAANPNSGIVDLLADIETAHSLTIAGNDYFPTVANGYPNLDRPAQKQNTNGAWIKKALAGTGINMSEEWAGSITAPELRWRPDWQDENYFSGLTTARMWNLEHGYPWLYAYPDVGLQYEDFVARVNVDGENAAGTQHYGWAQLYSAADRASVGNRDVTLDTWIDTAAGCQTQARRLMAYQCEPTYLKLNQFTLNTEHMYRVLSVQGGADPELEVFGMGAALPGDSALTRWQSGATPDGFGDGNPDYDDWPSHAPAGGDLYDTLSALWHPTLTYNATSSTFALRHFIRAVTRTFTPTGGWDVTYGVETQDDGVQGAHVSEYSNGTY